MSKGNESSKNLAHAAPAPGTNFIRNIIDADLAGSKFASRKWAGKPGMARDHAEGEFDQAKIRTRFPPEPNGYLHIGHAKSICLNFGLARDYGGRCHLRFDDTNPAKEEQEFVDAILDSIHWLGFDYEKDGESNLYFASDYFDWMYQFAECLIEKGHAYVDSLSAEEMREYRGTLTEKGKDSPFRDRSITESLTLFREMRDGKHADGAHILRAKIDMQSPNINLRDPAMYISNARITTARETTGASTPFTALPIRLRTRWNRLRTRSVPSNSKINALTTTGCWSISVTPGI